MYISSLSHVVASCDGPAPRHPLALAAGATWRPLVVGAARGDQADAPPGGRDAAPRSAHIHVPWRVDGGRLPDASLLPRRPDVRPRAHTALRGRPDIGRGRCRRRDAAPHVAPPAGGDAHRRPAVTRGTAAEGEEARRSVRHHGVWIRRGEHALCLRVRRQSLRVRWRTTRRCLRGERTQNILNRRSMNTKLRLAYQLLFF